LGKPDSFDDLNMRSQALVDAYGERLYRLAYRLCSNAESAKDLAFRTLEKALAAKTGKFADERGRFAWLCTILTNLYRDDLRLKAANALEFVDILPEMPDMRPDPAVTLETAERHAMMRKAVAALPLPLREVVVMHYFEDYPLNALSGILGIPVGTVKYRLYEARRALSRTIGQTFSEDYPLRQNGESDN